MPRGEVEPTTPEPGDAAAPGPATPRPGTARAPFHDLAPSDEDAQSRTAGIPDPAPEHPAPPPAPAGPPPTRAGRAPAPAGRNPDAPPEGWPEDAGPSTHTGLAVPPDPPDPPGLPGATDPAGATDSAAAALAENPRLWRILLFAHQPDRHGRCSACVSVRWPCGPRKLAERAEQIAEGRD
jgi:hypothetical protein